MTEPKITIIKKYRGSELVGSGTTSNLVARAKQLAKQGFVYVTGRVSGDHVTEANFHTGPIPVRK